MSVARFFIALIALDFFFPAGDRFDFGFDFALGLTLAILASRYSRFSAGLRISGKTVKYIKISSFSGYSR
ncbi:MAG: hypothetical protein LJE90_07870 [Betaproteobacteria bacterium]|nr:hypothetical protein [Betaproteobacteria bacterium]